MTHEAAPGPTSGPYLDAVAAITALASALDDGELATTVAATPDWTVHHVLAHLAGGPADSLTGRMDGAPGPAWTAVHVGERAGLPVPDLLAEIRVHAPEVQAAAAGSPRPAIVWDAVVHLADLHETLGRGRLDESLWRPVLDVVGPFRLGERSVDVEAYELFRGLFSRRSRAQMQTWGTGLSAEELDALPIFGPRDDDQPVP